MLDKTGSPSWVALAGIMRIVPYLLFGAIGGAVADRFERRTVMVTSDTVRTILMVTMAISAAAGMPALIIILLAFLTTTASTVYGPAAAAVMPAVVREDDLAAANTVINVVENVALALGPAIGGLLLLLGDPTLAFAVNAGTFAFAAILVRAMRVRSEPGEAEAEATVWQSVVNGINVARASSDVAVILGVALAVSLLYGQESVLLVLAADRLLGIGSEGAGFLYAAIGVGGLLGAAVTSRLASDPKPGRTLAVGLAISGFSFIGLGLTATPGIGIGVMTLDGVGGVLIEVLSITMLQRLVARDLLARAAALIDVVSVAGGLLGAVMAPVLLGLVGLRGALLIGGALLPLTALLALAKFRDMNKRAEAVRLQLLDAVAFLQRLRIFDGADTQAVELIARGMKESIVEPDTEVVKEGEPADAFYVIREGDLDVYSRGESGRESRKVNELSAGDYFGEIGLLERIPRTATVVAKTRCILYRVEGDEFLTVFTTAPSVGGPMMANVAGRLARTHPSHELASGP